MELTEEQRERIRRNREQALELQKRNRNKLQLTTNTENMKNAGISKKHEMVDDDDDNRTNEDRASNHESKMKRRRDNGGDNEIVQKSNEREQNGNSNDDDEIEAFEENASEYVTKQEAMKVYCLPLGTLEVCTVIEKPNPKNKTWQAMKLYHRNEIRRRAHARYGGIYGLINERNQRSQLKLRKDIEQSKDIFK